MGVKLILDERNAYQHPKLKPKPGLREQYSIGDKPGKKEVLGPSVVRLFSVTAAQNLGASGVSLPMVAQDTEGHWFVASKVPAGGIRVQYFPTEADARKALAELTDPTGDEASS